MKKTYLLVMLLLVAPVMAIDWLTDQTNIDPDVTRSIFTYIDDFNGSVDVNVVVPPGFSVSAHEPSGVVVQSNATDSGSISWTTVGSPVNWTLTSPINCTEGSRFFSEVTVNGSLIDTLVYVCKDDSKIFDFKFEYGHGDFNYLPNDLLYIPNKPVPLFDLIRMWPIGNHLVPNEEQYNATVNCTFPDYPTRISGRMEVGYDRNSSLVEGNCLWEYVSNSWFRICWLNQEVNETVGHLYNISCTGMTYEFEHQRVQTDPINISVEVRDKYPYLVNQTLNGPGKFIVYNITNNEVYPTRDISFEWEAGGYREIEELRELLPGESILYDAYVQGTNCSMDLTAKFIPSWMYNSRSPELHHQYDTFDYSVDDSPCRVITVKKHVFDHLPCNTTVCNLNASFDVNVTVNLTNNFVILCTLLGTVPYCGDGTCNFGNFTCETHYSLYTSENALTCPADCSCGDGICDDSETPATCPADCEANCTESINCTQQGLGLDWDCHPTTNKCYQHYCGDNICNSNRNESYLTCGLYDSVQGLSAFVPNPSNAMDCDTPCIYDSNYWDNGNGACIGNSTGGGQNHGTGWWCGSNGNCTTHTWCGDSYCNPGGWGEPVETALSCGINQGKTDCLMNCTADINCTTADVDWQCGDACKAPYGVGVCYISFCGDNCCDTDETELNCGVNQGQDDCLAQCDHTKTDGGYSDCSAFDSSWDCGCTSGCGDRYTSDVGRHNAAGTGDPYAPEGQDKCYKTTNTDDHCNAVETILTTGVNQASSIWECFENCTTDSQCLAIDTSWQCGDADASAAGIINNPPHHGVGYCYKSSCGDSVCDENVSYGIYTDGENVTNCGVNQGLTDCLQNCTHNDNCTAINETWYCALSTLSAGYKDNKCHVSICGDEICSGLEDRFNCGHLQQKYAVANTSNPVDETCYNVSSLSWDLCFGQGGDCNYCNSSTNGTADCVGWFGPGHICSVAYTDRCINAEVCSFPYDFEGDNSFGPVGGIDPDDDPSIGGVQAPRSVEGDVDCGATGGIVSGTEWAPSDPYLEIYGVIYDSLGLPFNQDCSLLTDDWNHCTNDIQCNKDICCYIDLFHGNQSLNADPILLKYTEVYSGLRYEFVDMNASWDMWEIAGHMWCNQTYGGSTSTLFHDASPVGHIHEWRGNISLENISVVLNSTVNQLILTNINTSLNYLINRTEHNIELLINSTINLGDQINEIEYLTEEAVFLVTDSFSSADYDLQQAAKAVDEGEYFEAIEYVRSAGGHIEDAKRVIATGKKTIWHRIMDYWWLVFVLFVLLSVYFLVLGNGRIGSRSDYVNRMKEKFVRLKKRIKRGKTSVDNRKV